MDVSHPNSVSLEGDIDLPFLKVSYLPVAEYYLAIANLLGVPPGSVGLGERRGWERVGEEKLCQFALPERDDIGLR